MQSFWLFLFSGLLLTGCASIPRQPGFQEVRENIENRSGSSIRWYQGQPEDVKADSAVRALLQDTLTEQEAVQIALLNNRRLQAIYENLGISQAQVVQAGLLSNPVFAGSAVYGLEEAGHSSLTFGLAFDFLDVIFIPLRKRIAASAYETTKLEVTGSVLDMAGQTRAAYYRMQADTQLLEIQQQIVQSTQASYEAVKALHDAGNVTRLDVINEQALYEQARLDLETARLNLRQSRERLNRLMGLWGKRTQWTASPRLPDVPEEPLQTEELEKRAVDASLDLAISRQEIITLGHSLGLVKRSAWLPALELGAEAEREDGEWLAGPEGHLVLPLFDQGQAEKTTARAQLRQKRAEYYALAVDVRSAARTAREQLARTRRRALHYRNVIVPLRSEISYETQLQYNAMQLGVFQLLQAKQQEIVAGRSYIEALYAYWTMRTEIDLLLQGRMVGLSEGISLEPGSTETTNSDRGH